MKLTAKKLVKYFDSPDGTEKVTALGGVDFDAESGEFVVLKGRSGSGKSTLLYLLARLRDPSEGEILWDGKPISRSTAQSSQGFVFQSSHLVPYLTVRENVLLPELADGAPQDLGSRADELLRELGLTDRINHRPAELSGGEQQRVAVARALVRNPKVVFADEPTGNLDEENSIIIIETLKTFTEGGGLVIIASHDPIVMNAGQRSIDLESKTN